MTARLLRVAGLLGLYVGVVVLDGACLQLETRERELARAREELAGVQAAGVASVLVGAMVEQDLRERLDDDLEAFDASDCLTAHDLAGLA